MPDPVLNRVPREEMSDDLKAVLFVYDLVTREEVCPIRRPQRAA